MISFITGQEVVAIFRINKIEGKSRTVVTIDGRLAGEYVPFAETFCKEVIASRKQVHVFLREVSAVDEAGRDLLGRLVRGGCRLYAGGAYNSHLIETLQRVRDRKTESSARARGENDAL
jgi:hypothetical protein